MKLKEFYMLSAGAIIIAQSLVLTMTFLTAYATPEKQILVTINSVNEANIELIATLYALPMAFYLLKIIGVHCQHNN